MTLQTKVSAKGQIVIPKSVRDELGWPTGTHLQVERIGGAVTLRPIRNKPGSLTLEEFVARRPRYQGPAKSLEEIESAVGRSRAERFAAEYKTKQ